MAALCCFRAGYVANNDTLSVLSSAVLNASVALNDEFPGSGVDYTFAITIPATILLPGAAAASPVPAAVLALSPQGQLSFSPQQMQAPGGCVVTFGYAIQPSGSSVRSNTGYVRISVNTPPGAC